MISVSDRLAKIESLVEGTVLADIGCDHAYIAINSVLSEKVKKAYACDIAEGPLQNAINAIEKYGVEDRVIPRLQSGIENLPLDVDVAVIAGMGGLTVIDILDTGQKYLNFGCRLIVSVHKDADKLRSFLSQHGYCIEKEYIVEEDGHYYPILCMTYSNQMQPLDEKEILYGKNVIQDRDYSSFIHHEYDKWNGILEKMPKDKGEDIRYRLMILKQLM